MKKYLFSFICSILICFFIGELIVRLFGYYDDDGNFYFFSRRLKPYRLSINLIKREIDEYLSLANTPIGHVIYDPLIGWVPRPMSKAVTRPYIYNADGIRAPFFEYTVPGEPQEGVLRIAIFGDSFTHGDDVPFENTWGYYLEQDLKESGINAEVLNFGVGAYGMDQALLYWKKKGCSFKPHIVIFGFQAENVNRNVNLIRGLYCQTLTFAKPRFILSSQGLKLINVPVVPPTELVFLLKNIDSWDLVRYEYWLRPSDYQKNIWLKSKLISLMWCYAEEAKRHLGFTNAESSIYSIDKEPAQVTLRIIKEFKEDVESHGAKFYLVHLPNREDLVTLYKDRHLEYLQILNRLEAFVHVIHTENNLLNMTYSSSLDSLYTGPNGHYTADSNKIVAEVIAKGIMQEEGLNRALCNAK